MEILNLPLECIQLHDRLNAPQILIRHHRIVYSMAVSIINGLEQHWPALKLNRALVLFGAATHDIGKIAIKKELLESGNKHELTGRDMLKQLGFSDEQARFALTHGHWRDENLQIEDLLVSLADKIWKGKRLYDLEEKMGQRISVALSLDYWEVYEILDNLLSDLMREADERISWQEA